MRRQLFVSFLAFAAAVGCGSLGNPNDNSIAKIQGQLSAGTGSSSIPANAHVAVVWGTATSGTLVVTNDAPVVGGAFTIDLSAPPPDAVFFAPQSGGSYWGSNGGGTSVAPSETGTATAPSPTATAGSSSATNVHLSDNATGTVSAQQMTAAVAGFIVYVDANGNGRLDVNSDSSSSTPDTIIGGSNEIVLTYLRDATDVDLRDLVDANRNVPVGGYNLASEKSGWLPLTDVDLVLGTDYLPSPVCDTSSYATGNGDVVGVSAGNNGSGGSASGTSKEFADASVPSSYPSPTDPNLSCSADGTTFYYSECDTTAVPPPPPPGLCSGGDATVDEPMPCSGYEESLPGDGTIPSGWPCTVTGDAGPPAGDGGAADAGAK